MLGKEDWKKASVAYLTGKSQTFNGHIGHFKDFDLYPKNSEKPLKF